MQTVCSFRTHRPSWSQPPLPVAGLRPSGSPTEAAAVTSPPFPGGHRPGGDKGSHLASLVPEPRRLTAPRGEGPEASRSVDPGSRGHRAVCSLTHLCRPHLQYHCCHRDDPTCHHPHRGHRSTPASPGPLLWATFSTCVTTRGGSDDHTCTPHAPGRSPGPWKPAGGAVLLRRSGPGPGRRAAPGLQVSSSAPCRWLACPSPSSRWPVPRHSGPRKSRSLVAQTTLTPPSPASPCGLRVPRAGAGRPGLTECVKRVVPRRGAGWPRRLRTPPRWAHGPVPGPRHAPPLPRNPTSSGCAPVPEGAQKGARAAPAHSGPQRP